MARQCEICRRTAKKSFSRSHSNIATNRRQHINLQIKTIDGKRVKICTSCIKGRSKKKK